MARTTRALGLAGLAAVAVMASGTTPAQADFINGGFEFGNFSGWTTIGTTSVIGASGVVVPPEGVQQARLTTEFTLGNVATLESFLGFSVGTLNGLGNGTVIEGSAIKQQITVNAGDTLSFRWNFLTRELIPSPLTNDFSFVSIESVSTLELADTLSPGFVAATGTTYSSMTGYQTLTHTFAAGGTYTIGVGVVNVTDGLTNNSAVMVDNFNVTAASVPVPVPAGAVLFGVGLVSLGGVRAFRRKPQAV